MLNAANQQVVIQFVTEYFFNKLTSYPVRIQIMACQAALSFKYYWQVLEDLDELNLSSATRLMGELLSHPAPQNPPTTLITVAETVSIPNNFVLVPSPENEEQIIPLRKGALDIADATQIDVKNFIEALLREKIQALSKLSFKEDGDSASEPDPESDKSEASPVLPNDEEDGGLDSFLNHSIEAQLNILGLDIDKVFRFDVHLTEFYIKFLSQFPDSKNFNAQEDIQSKITIWFAKCQYEYTDMRNFIGTNNENGFTFAHLVEAKLNRFDSYSTTKAPNFFIYRALQRVAILNSKTNNIADLESDFDTTYLLAISGQVQELEKNVAAFGVNMATYRANSLFIECTRGPVISLGVVNNLLTYTPVSNHHILLLLEKILQEAVYNNVNEIIFMTLLRSLKFTTTLSLTTCTLAYQVATVNNNLECQVLILLQAPPEFTAKKLLSAQTLFTLIEQGYYAAAAKMANMYYPQLLSIADLKQAEQLSHGTIKFGNQEGQKFTIARPSHILNQYLHARRGLGATNDGNSGACVATPLVVGTPSFSSPSTSEQDELPSKKIGVGSNAK